MCRQDWVSSFFMGMEIFGVDVCALFFMGMEFFFSLGWIYVWVIVE